VKSLIIQLGAFGERAAKETGRFGSVADKYADSYV
jgi:hypothetical protein